MRRGAGARSAARKAEGQRAAVPVGPCEYQRGCPPGTYADAASLWSKVFDAAGTTVPVTLMPYGNAVASVAEPHFTASVVITEPDGDFLGGEANASTTAKFTFDFAFTCVAKPVRVTV